VVAAPTPAVVADTTTYIPPEMLADLNVTLVSLYVGLDGDLQKESELLTDLDGFYDRLKSSEEAITTSQPSIGDFIEVYEPLLADGRDIISMHISSTISGTCESAMQARDQLSNEGKGGERVHVFDSQSGAGGMAMILLACARAVKNGATTEEAIAKATEALESYKMWFAVDTLEYLRRGGRIGLARAWIGTTLKIKPILTFDGEITPVERVRTRKRAFDRLVDYAHQRHEAGADAWVVQHVQEPELAQELVDTCRPVYGTDPEIFSAIGPVVGAHVGPGLLGMGATTRASLGLD